MTRSDPRIDATGEQMTTDTAAAILADLAEAFPLEDTESVLDAVADALKRYADITAEREPYATVSIRECQQAARRVADLHHNLTTAAEAEQ